MGKRPIQQKINRAILITSTAVLLLTVLAYLTYEYLTFREVTLERVSTLGEVISTNSTAALAFDSQKDAFEILSALKADEHIVAAALYDEGGNLFSKYPMDLNETLLPERINQIGYNFEGTYLHGFHPIILGSKPIGTLYLEYDLKSVYKQLAYFSLVAFVVFLLSLFMAYLLSYKLQKRIANPIISLANVAQSISIPKDYSVRAIKQSEDEIGLLTDAFNKMLTQIEEQSFALQESEEFSRTLLESTPDCVNALDLQGRLLTINPQGKKMMEIDDFNKVHGRIWTDLWRGDYHSEALTAVERARNGEIGHFQGLSATMKGNLKWWDVLIAPVYGPERKVERLVAVSRDITKLKELEQQKDDFIGIASHELKTPVTSIKAYTQVLQNRFLKNEDFQSAHMLTKMDNQVNKLTNLIGDLLDVTKIETGKLQFKEELFNFNDLVSDIVEEIQRTTERHEVVQKLGPTIEILGDRDRIGQVITNLLTNAIKYSPRANQVIVKTELGNEEICLSVQDYGLGLSEDDKVKVFERFYRVGESGQETFPGLGLGLYISAGIIQRHNGKIWAESKKGKGSTFCFALPLKNVNSDIKKILT